MINKNLYIDLLSFSVLFCKYFISNKMGDKTITNGRASSGILFIYKGADK